MTRLRDRGSGQCLCGARVRPPLTGEDPQLVPAGVVNWVAAVELHSACLTVICNIDESAGTWSRCQNKAEVEEMLVFSD